MPLAGRRTDLIASHGSRQAGAAPPQLLTARYADLVEEAVRHLRHLPAVRHQHGLAVGVRQPPRTPRLASG